MPELPNGAAVAIAGCLGGFILGLAARMGRFCTLAAIEDTLYAGDRRRFRMWVIAMATSIAGTTLLAGLGLIDLTNSVYQHHSLNLVAWILGGLLFGLGMAFCGTCAFGTLVRAGGGDLRSFCILIVLGASAYMAVSGPTAMFRTAFLDRFALPEGLIARRTLLDLSPSGANIFTYVLVLAVVALLTGWALSSERFRKSGSNLFWGVTVGSVVVFGWFVTGYLLSDPFNPQSMYSFTFALPVGQSLMFLMTMSSSVITFAIGATVGVVAGAFVGASVRNEFRWEAADDAREMRRHILGAFLMGTGGVFAGGCTIGQGLSAVSVLSISAPIVLGSIWLGAWFGLYLLMDNSASMLLKSVFGRIAGRSRNNH